MPWNLLTGPLYETHIIELIINVTVLAVVGSTLERLWGSLEFLRYFVALWVSCGLGCFLLAVVAFIVTLDWDILNNVYCGTSGIAMGMLVALKTTPITSHTVSLGRVTLRADIAPFAYLVFYTFLGLVFRPRLPIIGFVYLGLAFGLVYLRWFQDPRYAAGGGGDVTVLPARLQNPADTLLGTAARPLQWVLSSIEAWFSLDEETRGGRIVKSLITYDVPDAPSEELKELGADERRERALRSVEERVRARLAADTEV